MSTNDIFQINKLLSENTYPGRGIIIGNSADGKKALIAYFIMGRSVNSRNRIFEEYDRGMRTKAFDESKLSDPHLIIYNPYLKYGKNVDIITNGDQTDTIYDFIKENPDAKDNFEQALATREFEDDAPNFTPRISGILHYSFPEKTFKYKLSILKSTNGNPDACQRFFYNYLPLAGIGHFIHTYKCDGNPIPSFCGEPEMVAMPNTAQELADICWENLNEDNKVSLYVRETNLETGEVKTIIINKNK
ncbi:MAG: IMP cyclohydrolase [Clostridia bacterium]|nr:IMP cyclohydrolase [Clostridia bacterium]